MKRKKHNLWWTLLIIGLIMTSNGFSQTVIKDSSQILLPTPLAKLVVKDLIKYDGLKIEIAIKDKIIAKKDSVIKTDSTIIAKTNRIVINLTQSLKDSQTQLSAEQKIAQSYKDKLKQQKKDTWVVGGVGVAVGILIKVLFIK